MSSSATDAVTDGQSDIIVTTSRTQSFSSQQSGDSHTAADFINSQLQLEADAREALPYNFKNKFCGCECDYDAHSQKGTMFQCLGLGTAEQGGCGEDWWHPGCVVGLGPDWVESSGRTAVSSKSKNEGLLESITEVAEAAVEAPNAESTQNGVNNETENTALPPPEEEAEDDDPPLPPGFPDEEDFEGFICYKCVEAHPWIKKYAGAKGFLGPVFRRSAAPSPETGLLAKTEEAVTSLVSSSKKRKAEDDEESIASSASKRIKDSTSESITSATNEVAALAKDVASAVTSAVTSEEPVCKVKEIVAPRGELSLFFKSDFRDHLCRCADCFPLLKPHTHLLEEEENYEPEMSEGEDADGGSTVGSGSIYDRGESALKNVDRVRAIEGVMAYNHLKDKLKPFFQQFAESGQAISAEDIKAHFAKMRGDETGIQEAKDAVKEDQRKEQTVQITPLPSITSKQQNPEKHSPSCEKQQFHHARSRILSSCIRTPTSSHGMFFFTSAWTGRLAGGGGENGVGGGRGLCGAGVE
ncbi:putative E3 ubiquitin-protein ligase UBR7 [Glarea lozoyensis 74030]|uniref:Putative E3 ubiquitin-protein ligase UBR7 n=1 Tax=Glarea lozoyensis (strain ATCC 74030 / MF5533) TaxID=1104152 RepID=H0ET33_GLAL7|nr:putative E3 ubiquitin-protein ligase UBR7 [Glarea lozoyensis 74030]